MGKPLRPTLLPGLLAAALACAAAPAPAPPAPAPPQPAVEPPVAPPPCARIVRIEIEKSERLMRAVCERGAVVEMTAALGRRPLGPKTRAGDFRTPEGTYRVAAPPAESPFHLFILIDYPSPADARVAFEEGLISAEELEAIVAARERGELPPQDTALGGGIGIHGEGARWQGWVARLDWTNGCVALTDTEVDFVAARALPGTPVVIRP